jgi:hypothetical protein
MTQHPFNVQTARVHAWISHSNTPPGTSDHLTTTLHIPRPTNPVSNNPLGSLCQAIAHVPFRLTVHKFTGPR